MSAEQAFDLYFSEAPVSTRPEPNRSLPNALEVQFVSAPNVRLGTVAIQEVQLAQLNHEIEAICNEYPDWQENRQSYEAVVDLSETLSQPFFGTISQWKRAGEPRDDLPEVLQRLTTHKLFARHAFVTS